jgi:hypothetical protein
MREFQPYGVQFVVEALKKVVESEGNDPLVAVDAEAGNVRRKRPLEAQTDAWSRSVYVVRVPLESVCCRADLVERVRYRRDGKEQPGAARVLVPAVWIHQRCPKKA